MIRCHTCRGQGALTVERPWAASADCNARYELTLSQRPEPKSPTCVMYLVRTHCDHCKGRGSIPDVLRAAPCAANPTDSRRALSA